MPFRALSKACGWDIGSKPRRNRAKISISEKIKSQQTLIHMPANEKLLNRVREALEHVKKVEEKKMFGGLSFMVAGKMCCGVLKDQLVVRVGSEAYDESLAQPYTRPFDLTGRPSTNRSSIWSAYCGAQRTSSP